MTTTLLDAWRKSIVAAGSLSELDDIDPCLIDETDNAPIETDREAQRDAVQVCHEIAMKIEAIG
jgi:hypothetical protein